MNSRANDSFGQLVRRIRFGGDHPNVGSDDLRRLLADFVALAGWNGVNLAPPSTRLRPKVFETNETFWTSRRFESQLVTLQDFHVTEWTPASPGRYYTPKAAEARRNARDFYNDSEYLPLGKSYMILGGVGSVRLSAKQIGESSLHVLGASSTGITHEGVPVALRADLAREVRAAMQDTGGVLADIHGTVQVLPKVGLIDYPVDVRRHYVIADEVVLKRPSPADQLRGTVSVAFANSEHDTGRRPYVGGGYETRLEKAWCFATFRPGDDRDLRRACEWIQEYVTRHSDAQANKPPILSDFDEHVCHFESPVEFTLTDLLQGSLDLGRLEAYGREVKLTINLNQSYVGAVAAGPGANAHGHVEVNGFAEVEPRAFERKTPSEG